VKISVASWFHARVCQDNLFADSLEKDQKPERKSRVVRSSSIKILERIAVAYQNMLGL
jgi:hypothetical protein